MARASPAKTSRNTKGNAKPLAGQKGNKQYLAAEKTKTGPHARTSSSKDAKKPSSGVSEKNLQSTPSKRKQLKRKNAALSSPVQEDDGLFDTDEDHEHIEAASTLTEDNDNDIPDEALSDLASTPKGVRKSREELKSPSTPASSSDADADRSNKRKSSTKESSNRNSMPSKRLRLLQTPAQKGDSKTGARRYTTTHSTGKKAADKEYMQTLNREGPDSEKIEAQEELLSYLPGYHFPSRASKVKAEKRVLHMEDSEGLQELDIPHILQLVRVMLNVAFMR